MTAIRDEVVTLWRVGFTAGEIAGQLHVSRNAVMGHIGRARSQGVDLGAKRDPAIKPRGTASGGERKSAGASSSKNRERDAAIIAARMDGVGPSAIAASMKLSFATVAKVLAVARQSGKLKGEKALVPNWEFQPKPATAKIRPIRRIDPADAAPIIPPLCDSDERPAVAALHQAQQLDGCRWPFGDPRQAGFRFCCRPRAEAGYLSFTADPEPYCEDHRLRGRSKASAAIVRPWRGAV